MDARPGSIDQTSLISEINRRADEINRHYGASQKGLTDDEKSTQRDVHRAYGGKPRHLRNLYLLTRRDHIRNVETERNSRDPRPLEDRLEPSHQDYAQAADLLGLGGVDIMYDEFDDDAMGRPNVSQRIENASKGYGYITDAGRGTITHAEADAQRAANAAEGRGRITNVEAGTQRAANVVAGHGSITDAEADAQRAANAAAGRGRITNEERLDQRHGNVGAGHDWLTDAEVEAQKRANAAAGRGRISDREVRREREANAAAQRAANAAAGHGTITHAEADAQREANAAAGRGMVTHQQARVQIAANTDARRGAITDAEVETQRAANADAGLGEITHEEVERQIEKNSRALPPEERTYVTDAERRRGRVARDAVRVRGRPMHMLFSTGNAAVKKSETVSEGFGSRARLRSEIRHDMGRESQLTPREREKETLPAVPFAPPYAPPTDPTYQGFGGRRKTHRRKARKSTAHRRKSTAHRRKSTAHRRKRPQTRKRR